ncbi:MAG: ABC-2 transporter permease [Oscillospiraceae bacterium]
MKNLLYKEFRLCILPGLYLFFLGAAMLLIPSYPYYVAFFYQCIALQITTQYGRDKNDVYFSVLLPIKKRDVVKARFCTAAILQCAQIVLAIPFAVLRYAINPAPNVAGIEANVAFFGLVFLLFGVFNFIFFTQYYKAPHKLAGAFIKSMVVVLLFIAAAEALVMAVPLLNRTLDTIAPAMLGVQILVLLVCIGLYLLLMVAGYKKSAKVFEQLDF